jgi:hypothetical protein
LKLVIFTIVLDGMPYLPWHLPMLNRLACDWTWHVIEGVAMPNHCTRWCTKIEPRLSTDGTTEYLDSIAAHPRVRVHRKPSWDGKLEMVNTAMGAVDSQCLLLQVDSDELWQAGQIETIRQMFIRDPSRNVALFTCRYFVGHNIAVLERGGYGNNPGEWARAFRVDPGMRFAAHEPPVIEGLAPVAFEPDDTEKLGLIFDHYAYATRKQVEFKERYYGYAGAAAAWDRLQANREWPAKLRNFLPWVKSDSIVRKVA